MILPTLVGPAYRSQSRTVDPSELINWYLETVEDVNAQASAVLVEGIGGTSATEAVINWRELR